MKINKGYIKSTMLYFTSLILIMIVILGIFPVSVGAYKKDTYYLNKSLNLTPHQDFGNTTISHFNEACWQWNRISNGNYTLTRSAAARHRMTDFFTAKKTDCGIYKVSDPNEAPGTTQIKFNSDGKTVHMAAVNLNPAKGLSNGEDSKTYDVWTIFVHELGHIVGLDHVTSSSVMQVLPVGSRNRYTTADDERGVKAIFK